MRYTSSPLAALLLSSLSLPHAVTAKQVAVPLTSLDSPSNFDAEWGYNYPWGTDHNGAARMAKSQVTISGGTLTITAKRVNGEKPASHGGKQIAIKYLSGAIYAKEHFNVTRGGGFDFLGEFRATTTRGTWPAFWLTGVKGWPPEIDMAEWKGSGKISFNTFNTSSQVRARDVNYPSPGEFHKIRCEVRDQNGRDVAVKFFMDENLIEMQYGHGFVGQPMYL